MEMLGRKNRRQPELFVAGSLRDLLPDDHVLVRVDRVLDLSWLHDEIADLYDAAAGRPSIDPEVAVRLPAYKQHAVVDDVRGVIPSPPSVTR